MCKRTDL